MTILLTVLFYATQSHFLFFCSGGHQTMILVGEYLIILGVGGI